MLCHDPHAASVFKQISRPMPPLSPFCRHAFGPHRFPSFSRALLLGIAFHFLYDEAECQSGIDFANRSILRLRVALLAPVIFLLRLAIAWSGQRSEGAGRRPPLLPAFVPACRRWVNVPASSFRLSE